MTTEAHSDSPVQRVPQWRHDRRSILAGALVSAALFGLAVLAARERQLPLEALLVAGVVLAWVTGQWHGTGRGRLSYALAGIGLCATAWLWGDVPPTLLAAAGVLSGGVLITRDLRRREQRGQTLDWLAGGLVGLARDDTPRARVVSHPQWEGRQLTSVRWHHPEQLATHDTRAAEKVVELARTRLGEGTYRVEWRTGYAQITRESGDAGTPPKGESETRPADEQRLAEVVDGLLTGATIHDVDRDKDGRICGFLLRWPAKRAREITSRGKQVNIARQLATACGRRELTAAWRVDEDEASFTLPAEIPDFLPLPGRGQRGTYRIPLGVFRGGEEVVLDLDSHNPHCLMIGRTGGGKSVFLRSFCLGLPDGCAVVLCDPKRISLAGMEQLPNVVRRDSTIEAMIAGLEDVHSQMMQRYADIERDPSREAYYREHRLVWACDEGKQFYDVLKRHWNEVEKPARSRAAKSSDAPAPTGTMHPLWGQYAEILQLGREAGVHVVMCTQQPDADWLGSGARGNFGVRVCAGDVDSEAARMLFKNDLATRSPGDAPGRAWVGIGRSPVRIAQLYYTPKLRSQDPRDRQILAELGLDDDGADTTTDATAGDRRRGTLREIDFGARPVAGSADRHDADGQGDDDAGGAYRETTEDPDVDTDDERGRSKGTSQKENVDRARPAAGAAPHDHEDGDELEDEPNPRLRRARMQLVPDPDLDHADEGDEPDLDDLDLDDLDRAGAWDLSHGQRIVADLDSGPRRATVLSVDPDDLDPDTAAVWVRYEDGSEAVLAVDGDATVALLR